MTTSTRRRAPLLRATRPRQWSKNLLVLAAPLAAGVLAETDVIGPVAVALVAFTACAAAVYLINDVVDVEDDRRHPRKRHRPVASGELKSSTAIATAVVLATAAVALAVTVRPLLAAVLMIYLVVQVAYAYWLKDQPVLDLAVVSSGFLLRAIAGGVAADVPLSQWFLLVASFGSLFMVAGKRYSELLGVGPEGGTRPALALYSESYLRFVWSMAAAVAVTAYSLWAFEIPSVATVNWQALSIAPFVLGMLRYAVDIDRGLAGEPEDAVMRDPVLLVLAAVWIGLFAVGVYVS